MIRRRRSNPLRHALPYRNGRQLQLAHRLEKRRNVLVENLLRSLGRRRLAHDVHAAAVPELHPPLARQLAVARAHRVGMDAEPPRQLARTRQPLARLQVAAQNRQLHLRHQLLVDRNFTGRRKPEPHRLTPTPFLHSRFPPALVPVGHSPLLAPSISVILSDRTLSEVEGAGSRRTRICTPSSRPGSYCLLPIA